MTKKEFLVQDDSPVLKDFIKTNCEQLESLIKDSKTAQVSQQKLWTTPLDMPLDIYYKLSDSACLPAGDIRVCGGVFRREPQNNAAFHVFPAVCTLDKGL